jgi:hypothetical protein
MQDFQIHDFSKGMNLDKSLLRLEQGEYLESNNFRVTTEEGSTSLSITNPLGNTHSFTLPVLSGYPNLRIIGNCVVRDKVIIFSTNVTNTTGGFGQIWEINYDPITKDHVSTNLLYNNNLLFSTQYPVKALGIFENEKISHVYFSNNHANPYAVNITDPDLINKSPDMIKINTPYEMSVPTLRMIEVGGILPAGGYQLFYFMKNKYGTITGMSPVGSQINIVSSVEGASTGFQEYEGTIPGTVTSKLIRFAIKGLDTNYDSIEVGYLYYTGAVQIPVIKIFKEVNITGSSITSTLTGGEQSRTISYEEFLSARVIFDTVKELTSKDNTLYFLNTRTKDFDIDFDARAYRYKLNSNNTYVSLPVPEDADAINPYNDENPDTNPDWDANDQFKYKQNSNILGGTGPNVSYEFTVRSITGDVSTSQGSHTPPDKSAPIIAPFTDVYTTGDFFDDFGIPGVEHNQPNHFNSFKSPYIAHTYTGYARGEVYRFGIVFYKSGKASFVKWIGDIKFPSISDVDGKPTLGAGSPGEINTYPIGREEPFFAPGSVELATMGITFTVDISSIRNDIDGYSIVRVERTENDKTRLGTGILNTLWKNNSATPAYFMPTYRGRNNADPAFTTMTTKEMYNFDSPDVHFNTIRFKEGDYIKILQTLDRSVYSVGFEEDSEWIKYKGSLTYQTHDRYPLKTYKTVNNFGTIAKDISVGIEEKFLNLARRFNDADNIFTQAGSRTSLITLDTELNTVDYNITDNLPTKKLLISYERYNSAQYGGNTYSDRTKNEYISCNNYVQVNSNTSNSLTFRVYGGDTYVTFYDHTKLEKNWGEGHTGFESGDGNSANKEKYFTAQMYPVECSFNVDLRRGYHFAKKTDFSGVTQVHDVYNYDAVYSKPNNIRVFFAKPINFESSEIQDHRIWASQVKTSGEYTDSWTIFRPADYLDLESQYGEINAALIFNDRFLVFQNRGMGMLLTNPMSLIQDTGGSELVLGTGNKLQRFNYMSTNVGSSHQWGVLATSNAVYWYDSLNKGIYTIAEEVSLLSLVKGVSSLLRNNFADLTQADNPYIYNGVSVGYDAQYNEVLFSFIVSNSNLRKTLVFSDYNQFFRGFYSINSPMYINTGDKLLSLNPSSRDSVYLHNRGNYCQFYNNYFNSDISIVTNKHPDSTKTLDNIEIHSNSTIGPLDDNTCFDEYIGTNSYQTTGVITNPNLIRRERTWKMHVPRDSNNSIYTTLKSRMRDKYLISKFTLFNSAVNRKFVLDFIKVLFRRSIS